MLTAFVLSAGGTHSPFEVGAVKYLYEVGIRPDIMCGTSGGALNSAKLAEDGPNNRTSALDSLERQWRELRRNDQMYREELWFQNLETEAKKLLRVWAGAGTIGRPELNYVFSSLLRSGFYFPLFVAQTILDLGIELRDLRDAVDAATTAKALFNLNPTIERLRKPENFNPDLVKMSGVRLRLATVDLYTGEVRYIDEEGNLYDESAISRRPERAVSLVDAAIASASIPVAFPPTLLNENHYIDGGVRAFAPISAAYNLAREMDPNGPLTIYAMLTAKPAIERLAKPYEQVNLLDISLRTADILINEILETEVNPPPRGWDVPIKIIRPTIALPDSLTIDPGLISIYIDYGYMRAWDVVNSDPFDPSNYPLTDDIIALRLKLWSLEQVMMSVPYGSAADLGQRRFREIREGKRSLLNLIRQRIAKGAGVPSTFSDQWWIYWENHPFEDMPFASQYGSPWDRLGSISREQPPKLQLDVLVESAIVILGIPATVKITVKDQDLLVSGATATIEGATYPLGDGSASFTHTFQSDDATITISAPYYPDVTRRITISRRPPPTIVLSLEPPDSPTEFDKEYSVKVRAIDDVGNDLPGGRVHVKNPLPFLGPRNNVTANTGDTFSFTFKKRAVPRTGLLVLPEGTVEVPGFENATIDFNFSP